MARVFSGIQPTGEMHLGNYLGAVRRWVAEQDDHDAIHCVVDLHAMTIAYEPSELAERTRRTAMLLMAAGLDPQRTILFVQSHVRVHTELTWVLNCVAAFGELRRMTQFKEKSEAQEFVSAGLFDYPVLMAADILAYDTDEVPVGEDQRQHLELARDLAIRFNHRYGDTLVVPTGTYPSVGARVKDLQNPTAKMSKSSESPQGTVLLLDPPKTLAKKIKSAVTDSDTVVRYAPDEKPGVSNLLEIMSVATGEPIDALERRFVDAGYGEFKEAVGESVVSLLAPIRERYEALRADERELQRLLAVGAEKARRVAEPTLETMYERMGFAKAEAGRFFGAARPRGL